MDNNFNNNELNNNPKVESKKELFSSEIFIDGLLGFLFVLFVNVFTMPVNLWFASLNNLANFRKRGMNKEFRNTDIPVFTWLVYFGDVLILLTPVLILLGFISLFFEYRIKGSDFASAVAIYFFPIVCSLYKELIGFIVSLVNKTSKIENNTRK